MTRSSAATLSHMADGGSQRAPFQVLVLPAHRSHDGSLRYALFRRADDQYWQGIAGGGESGESPLEAARREAAEEAGLTVQAEFIALDSMTTIPVVNVTGDLRWGDSLLVIPEYAYGACCDTDDVTISDEHSEFRWFTFGDAVKALRWDSNRNALWELDYRLQHGLLPSATQHDGHA